MAQYRKTALVEAEQFLPAEGQIPAGVYASGNGDPRKRHDLEWMLKTLEGEHILRDGDYICTGPAGERWNVAREIFEATYEPVSAITAEASLTLALEALKPFGVAFDRFGSDCVSLGEWQAMCASTGIWDFRKASEALSTLSASLEKQEVSSSVDESAASLASELTGQQPEQPTGLGPWCPACQANPRYGYCKLKGCPMPQPEGQP